MDPIVVVGGGIAGTTCASTLAESHKGEVILITVSHLIKVTKNLEKSGRNLEDFNVEEIDVTGGKNKLLGENVKIIVGLVEDLNTQGKFLLYSDYSVPSKKSQLKYSKLCICTGASPKNLPVPLSSDELSDKIFVIRDTQTVETFKEKLESSRRVIIVGNGGIAIELAYFIRGCHIVWVIKEDTIGSTFFDSGAAKFFLDSLHIDNNKDIINQRDEVASLKKYQYSTSSATKLLVQVRKTFNSALGPDWIQDLKLVGSSNIQDNQKDNLTIEESACLLEVTTNNIEGDWPMEVKLSNGKSIGCDIILIAIGVKPNTDWIKSSTLESSLKKNIKDSGLLVDTEMRTTVEDIYAAGDVVSCDLWARNLLWHQMRLWTQARKMGQYSARCIMEHMQNRSAKIYFDFECFSHVTRFFGYKVILLGNYHARNLENYEVMLRVNPPKDYIRLILHDGRLRGAIIVGETELEETFENLILDEIDVSRYGERLLDGTVDIEDYFD